MQRIGGNVPNPVDKLVVGAERTFIFKRQIFVIRGKVVSAAEIRYKDITECDGCGFIIPILCLDAHKDDRLVGIECLLAGLAAYGEKFCVGRRDIFKNQIAESLAAKIVECAALDLFGGNGNNPFVGKFEYFGIVGKLRIHLVCAGRQIAAAERAVRPCFVGSKGIADAVDSGQSAVLIGVDFHHLASGFQRDRGA